MQYRRSGSLSVQKLHPVKVAAKSLASMNNAWQPAIPTAYRWTTPTPLRTLNISIPQYAPSTPGICPTQR